MKLLSHDLCDSGLIRTKLGLGFQRTERRRREEEGEAIKKNERNSGLDLLYKALDRVGSDPIQRPAFQAV